MVAGSKRSEIRKLIRALDETDFPVSARFVGLRMAIAWPGTTYYDWRESVYRVFETGVADGSLEPASKPGVTKKLYRRVHRK